MSVWKNTFWWFCLPKGNEKAFFGALQERSMLMELHLGNSAADKNWVMAAEVERAEKKERKLFHLGVKVIWNKWFHI